jgi:hypothetical protein
MRWLRLAVPAIVLAAWLAASFAQQGGPPAGTPPASTPPATRTPPASRPPPAAPPTAPPAEEAAAPAAPEEDADVFIPTEELQPDAAVTFPVDI